MDVGAQDVGDVTEGGGVIFEDALEPALLGGSVEGPGVAIENQAFSQALVLNELCGYF